MTPATSARLLLALSSPSMIDQIICPINKHQQRMFFGQVVTKSHSLKVSSRELEEGVGDVIGLTQAIWDSCSLV